MPVVDARYHARIRAPRALTNRAEKFCLCYSSLLMDTCGNGRKSAEACGYTEKQADAVAYRLLHDDRALKRIKELEAVWTAELSPDWIAKQHLRLQRKAEAADDLGTATRNVEDLGRMQGVYRDSLAVEAAPTCPPELEGDALRLAHLLLTGGGDRLLAAQATPTPIHAEIVDPAQSSGVPCESEQSQEDPAKAYPSTPTPPGGVERIPSSPVLVAQNFPDSPNDIADNDLGHKE